MIKKVIRADKSVAYRVRVGIDGPLKTFDRKEAAVEYEAEQKLARQRSRAGLGADKPNVTFQQLVDLWEANFDPSQWRMTMIRYATDRWGKVKVRDIQPEQLGEWITNLTGRNGQPLAEKTRAHVLETMRQVLNAGVEWGYLSKSPARRGAFKPPSKKAREHPIRPLESWDEVLAVAAACASRNPVAGPLVRFACATGIRVPGELITLRWDQIDLPGRVMTVGSKTAAGHRTVPLSGNALAALAELPRSLRGPVFIGKTGGLFDYLNWRKTDWREALQECSLEHRTPYEMRHTFATLALAHGASIDDVATVMGHEDIAVAFNYYRKWIRTMADRLRATLDTIKEEPREIQVQRSP